MELTNAFYLAGKTEQELSGLFTTVSQTLARTDPGTPERRNALGLLENIAHARAVHLAMG